MPTPLQWLPEYSVGQPILDQQHRRLLAIIGDLAECADGEGKAADLRFHDILNDLSLYAREHFVTEENLLAQRQYSELETQCSEHAAYETQLTEIMTNAVFGKLEKGLLLHFLRSWWLDHILGSDMRYRPLFLAD